MTLQIDVPPEGPRPVRKRPADFTSRRFRLKLAMLLGTLLVVVVLMQEARRPENWAWMGFETKPPETEQNQDQPETTSGSLPGQGTPLMTPEMNGAQQARLDSPEIIERLVTQGAATSAQYPVQATLFWDRLLSRIGDERRTMLFRLMRICRTGVSEALEPPETWASLLKLVEQQRTRFDTKLLDTISFLDDRGQKELLNQQLFESKAIWRDKILPAFQLVLAGEEITIGQLKAIERLQNIFDRFSYRLVVDNTALNRPVEGDASLRMWEKALAMSSSEAQPVTQIQLTGQPDTFRGRPVKIGGWVRRVVRKSFPRNELGLDHVYVLWIRPEDSNSVPFCVYCQELVDGFEDVGSEMLTVNERVEVSGVFYKLRSYVAESESVLQCPLVYAKSFELSDEPVAVPVESWRPTTWMLILFFVGMPLLAAWIAVSVFRNSRLRRFIPGAKSQEKIARTLVELKDDEGIETDMDRIRRLEQEE